MQQRIRSMLDRQPDPLTLAAGTWLASGLVLLCLTPYPLHDTSLGWTATFWLVLAPAIVLGVRAWSTRTRRIASTPPARSRHPHGARPRDRNINAATVRRERGGVRQRAQRRTRRFG
ncbi:MAG TPA: hypothetical protein VFL63_04200 [Rhodanobacteraceae bacterium]|jgi:hypothetical protein|nr:hypothetical protein [Rhodanobacteraceae bacterium]